MKSITKFFSDANKEADISLKVDKIMDILKSEKFDINKSEIFNRVRVKFQVSMENNLEGVSQHKLDLESSLKEITSPIDAVKVNLERSFFAKLKDTITMKNNNDVTKVA